MSHLMINKSLLEFSYIMDQLTMKNKNINLTKFWPNMRLIEDRFTFK